MEVTNYMYELLMLLFMVFLGYNHIVPLVEFLKTKFNISGNIVLTLVFFVSLATSLLTLGFDLVFVDGESITPDNVMAFIVASFLASQVRYLKYKAFLKEHNTISEEDAGIYENFGSS